MQTLPPTQNWLPDFGRTRPARRRVWAVLLAFALACAAFMHVAHTHEADAPATYKFCSFCTTLDRGGAPPPVVTATVPRIAAITAPLTATVAAPVAAPSRTPRHPRAPPALQA